MRHKMTQCPKRHSAGSCCSHKSFYYRKLYIPTIALFKIQLTITKILEPEMKDTTPDTPSLLYIRLSFINSYNNDMLYYIISNIFGATITCFIGFITVFKSALVFYESTELVDLDIYDLISSIIGVL